MTVPQRRTVVGGDLTERLHTKITPEALQWLREAEDQRVTGVGILVSVAILRLAEDLRAYGDVELLLHAPRASSLQTISGELPDAD